MEIGTNDGSVVLNGNNGVAIGSSQTVNLPIVKVGEPLDFEIRIPQTAGAIGVLPAASIYVNGISIGKTNFNTGGSTDNKVVISSASTKGTNKAILIENFGSVININDDDISSPMFGGANVVDNPIYTFESNEKFIGYQVNDGNLVTVEPTYQIRNICLSHGINDVIVSDLARNIDTYQVNNTAIDNTATANDNKDGNISDGIVVTYYKADGTLLTELYAARTELGAGRNVVVKYNVSDEAGNVAVEVSATFTAVISKYDHEAPVIKIRGHQFEEGTNYVQIYMD